MDINDTLKFIRQLWFFSVLGDEELSELISTAELKSYNAGEIVFNQGGKGDRFFIVYSGKIRIIRKDKDKTEINLGVMTRGDHFGETALISDQERNATTRAVEDSILISISKESFNKYIFSKPRIREHFDKFIKYTSIHVFLKSCSRLSALPPQDLRQLVDHFKPEFFRPGEVVFTQGAAPDKFYLIETGKLKIVRWEGDKSEIINFLREGEFFGEKALLEDTTRYADVVCLTDCHLFSLSKEAFQDLVNTSPKMKHIIEDRIASYLKETPPIPYKEIIKEELAALKDIRVEKEVRKEEPEAVRQKKNRFKKLSSYYYRHMHFPFIRQYDEMSCGTTCLMMIAKFYGKIFSSSRLRELAYVDRSGASLANLAFAAEQIGFTTRGMKLDYEKLMSVQLPCIIHWQGYHYIVVYRITEDAIWVADPARGLRRYKKGFFTENWKGITLILEPTPELKKQEENISSVRNFIQFVIPYRKILFEILVASVILNIFGLTTPIFTQNIIDKVILHNNFSLLNIMLLGMIIVIIFRFLVEILRQYLIVHTSMKIDLRMLIAFYKHMLALPLGYFKVRKIGDFIERFGENMKIRNFLTNTALTLVLDTILITIYLSIMFYYNVTMASMVIFLVPVYAAITLTFTPVLKRLNVDSFQVHSESGSHLIESINAIDTVKAMNIEYPIRWRWEDKFVKSLNIDFKLFNTSMYFHSLGNFVGLMSSTLLLWYGAHKVMQNVMTIGELMAFMALVGSVITPINRIIMSWDQVQQTLVSVDRLNDVFSAKAEHPETSEDTTGIVIREPKGEIIFDKVFFRYGGPEEPYILSNIDMKIEPGKSLAIVGRSGSGKTTLVKLISKFYDVTEGKITIDGMDVRNINLNNLRQIIGFVLQENFIFNGTIKENISMNDPQETMSKVIEAATMANAHDFISGLALGYETKVGESGLQLSGGQKQRIAIARVLYRNSKIIIFDEATSSLDTESEQAIQKNMNTILKDKTAIIIAHRLSTVRNADRIAVLDNGEIVESGNHEELMERRGLYHYLVHQQLNL
ncbi:MAG: peptidase domain-containing ABC transporter [Deltaproteobacteria bacterium]|nr:peptidase domain-containing ABC transporter [Deltaproteobacteria bacterium]